MARHRTRNSFTTNGSDNIYGSDGASLIVPLSGSAAGGYKGSYTLGLSGLPAGVGDAPPGSTTPAGSESETTGDTPVDTTAPTVTVVSAGWSRSATNRRRLRVKVTTSEASTISARVTRGGATLGSASKSTKARATRTVVVPVSRNASGGKARLRILATDTAGNTRTVTKSVTVPRKLL